ncbi:LacI family transcriptional regulator [Kitasatospora sp. NBC_00240]|uniref:LacI family DNA-binding transcriptional regulator n=1 Tax=Kitasatospora sp. NBC_00240 TaxID=2903567 RepID=UPI002255F9B3|nr:LacI family DNA-binding transcriptional regulator [Kitasatospora sp. NBC_00240]MCX5214668.1 LacI family transcriptional regulator [Kitasatospora sp. NBC_00240]
MSPRVTIRDVAARAGVSAGAVSMAFNERPGLARPTRERIRAAAAELGWTPSQAARRLAGSAGRIETVGLVIARPARQLGLEPFYMEFISGIEAVLQERSASLLLRLVRDRDQEIAVQSDWWRTRRVSGSILVDLTEDDPRIPALARIGMPTVAAGHPGLAGQAVDAVWTDDAAAIEEAVRYLAVLGHRRIARVGGDPALGHTAIRTRALERITRELDLEPARTLPTDFSGHAGARATRVLLAAPGQRPTAIIYDNDIMAVAGIAVAAELGLRVPRDLSLIAWDDSQLCRLTHPTLSAMSHDVHGFGVQVTRTLFDVVNRTSVPSGPAPTPVLVPRGSSAPPGR